MQTATIRYMRRNEIKGVADLLLRANAEHLETFPESMAVTYRTEMVDVAHRLTFTEVFVAELGDAIVGAVTLLPDAQDDEHAWPPGGAVLRLLAVDPAARGQGIGANLTTTCVNRARETAVGFLGLHTAASMVAARRLYEQAGFERAPEHDFDPLAHYGGTASPAEDSAWGLAYVLDLAPDG